MGLYDFPPFPNVDPASPDSVIPDPYEQLLMQQAQHQVAVPNDFWARVGRTTGGPFMQGPVVGRHLTGLEALASLFSGFANAKAQQGAQRVAGAATAQQSAGQAAADLAKHRWNKIQEARKAEQDAALKKELAQMARGGAGGEPTETVVGPNGKPMIVRRSESYGKEAFVRPAQTAAPNLIPVQLPDGSVSWVNPKVPPPPNAKPYSAGRNKPTSRERDQLNIDYDNVLKSEDISQQYRPEFVGPSLTSVGPGPTIASATGMGLRPGESAFRASLSTYNNNAIKTLSGAQTSKQEIDRLKKQSPQIWEASPVFEEKLDIQNRNVLRAAWLRRNTYSKTGIDISELDPLPGGDQRVTVIRNGQRGTVRLDDLRQGDKVQWEFFGK